MFGLGYVGCVTAACLADEGHEIYGVDVNPIKVDMINQGQCPIVEKGLDTLIARVVGAGRLTATTLASAAIDQSVMSLVCVGTPSRENGSLDLQYLVRSSEEIGQALARTDAHHVVVIRSTVLPGTVHNCLIPVLERHSGRSAGDGFGVCVNPEFLREGSSLADFYDPPYTLIGEHVTHDRGTRSPP